MVVAGTHGSVFWLLLFLLLLLWLLLLLLLSLLSLLSPLFQRSFSRFCSSAPERREEARNSRGG